MKSILLVLSGAALLVTSGCYVRAHSRPATVGYSAAYSTGYSYQQPTYVTVRQPPPPLQPAVTHRPQPPMAGAVWVDGHYAHNAGAWLWVGGSWQTPQAGHVWQPPVCVTAPTGGYQYHPGYWRPHNARPAPVYQNAGTVRVSVRPAHQPYRPTGTVAVHTGGHTGVQHGNAGTVTVQGGVRPNTGHSNVTVQGRPGTVTVQGRPHDTVQVRPNTGHSNVTVQGRPSGNVTVQGRPATGNTVVQGGVQHARPGVTVQQGRPATNVTVQGRPNAGNVVVQGGVQHARPGVTVQGRPTGATVTARPTAVHAGTVTATQNPNVQHSGTVGVTATGNQLRCRVSASRVRRGSTFNITGNGFGARTSVRIGGQVAAVVNRTGGRLRVQMPPRGNGGVVSVVTNNRSASCGNVSAY